jgi:hypothetical protein
MPGRLPPDSFAFAILDNDLYNLPTTGIGDTFLMVNLGPTPSVTTGFSTSPGVTVSVTAVPEPGSLAWVSRGLMVFGLWRRLGVRLRG